MVARTGRRTKLTPRVRQRIVDTIRRGTWDYVAAETAGIDQSTFRRWIQRGDPEGTDPVDAPFRAFRAAVEGAQAEARSAAEQAVLEVNPLAYLRNGPGRHRPGRDGWTGDQGARGEGQAGDGPGAVVFTFDVVRATGNPLLVREAEPLRLAAGDL